MTLCSSVLSTWPKIGPKHSLSTFFHATFPSPFRRFVPFEPPLFFTFPNPALCHITSFFFFFDVAKGSDGSGYFSTSFGSLCCHLAQNDMSLLAGKNSRGEIREVVSHDEHTVLPLSPLAFSKLDLVICFRNYRKITMLLAFCVHPLTSLSALPTDCNLLQVFPLTALKLDFRYLLTAKLLSVKFPQVLPSFLDPRVSFRPLNSHTHVSSSHNKADSLPLFRF